MPMPRMCRVPSNVASPRAALNASGKFNGSELEPGPGSGHKADVNLYLWKSARSVDIWCDLLVTRRPQPCLLLPSIEALARANVLHAGHSGNKKYKAAAGSAVTGLVSSVPGA